MNFWQKNIIPFFFRIRERARQQSASAGYASPVTYVIGDIHGEYHLLKKMIRRLPLKPQDKLIFVGDYIDRGKNSKQVVDFILSLKDIYEVITLRGNHEQEMLDTVVLGKKSLWLMKLKGHAMIRSYSPRLAYKISHQIRSLSPKDMDNPQKIIRIFKPFWNIVSDTHKNFFFNLQAYYEDDEYVVSHAGLPPGQKVTDVTNERDFYYGNILPGLAEWHGPRILIVGHMPTYKINRSYFGKPFISANARAIAIDTGVYKTGILTAIRLSDRAFFQVRK